MKKLLVVLSVTLVVLSVALLVFLFQGPASDPEPERGEAPVTSQTGEVNRDLVRGAEIGRVIRQSVDTEKDFERLAERIQQAQKTEVRQGLIREFQLAAAKTDPAKRAELYALLERLL